MIKMFSLRPIRVIIRPEKKTAAAQQKGLAAWWECGEGSGALLADSSGNGNTGTEGNAAWQAATGRGTKPSFNGNNTGFQVAASESFQAYGKETLTIMAWCYAKSEGTESFGRVFDNNPADGICEGPGYAMFTTDEAGGSLKYGISFAGDDTTLGYSDLAWGKNNVNISVNEWHHIVGTFNEAGTKRLLMYVDGVNVALTEELQMQGDVMDDSDQDAGIGYFHAQKDEGFDGYLDDIRIYNYGLTAAEVLAIYNATA